MDNAAAATTRHPSCPTVRRRVGIPASEWMRWNDVAMTIDTLPPPLDIDRRVDPAATTERTTGAT